MNNSNDKLYSAWVERWKNCKEEQKLTVLGRAMFKAKRSVLARVAGEFRPASILEAGCALGETMAVYHEMGMDVMGVDISEDAVALCKRKGLNAVHMDMADLDRTFDMVSSDGMLEHFLNFEPHAKTLMELAERYVLLIQPNYNSFMGQTLPWLANIIRGTVNVYEYNYRLEDFEAVFKRGGFDLVMSEPVFLDVFRVLVFQRRGQGDA
ncbi:class I SAM-dependent methyltransferase [Pseudodesulfovibrio sp.]|nr:class I SAM-dependent methyltransferase [Pseudodesulfovibrio sp.]